MRKILIILFIVAAIHHSTAEDTCINDEECFVEDLQRRICKIAIGDINGVCAPGCRTDSDCPTHPKLDPTSNPFKNRCANEQCVEGCRPSSVDESGLRLTSNQCPEASSTSRCNTNFNVDGTGAGKCDVECRGNNDCRTGITSDSFYRFCKIGTLGAANECAGCRTSVDCQQQKLPVCTSGTCEGCTKNTDCSAHPAGRICKKTSITGVTESDPKGCGCDSNADCTGKLHGSICNLALGVCTCDVDTDCKVAGFKICSETGIVAGHKTCGTCKNNEDCPQSNGEAFCAKGEALTAENPRIIQSRRCLNTEDCSSSTVGGRSIGGVCGCRDDDDCIFLSSTPACDCAASKCIACTKDKHCKSFQRCNDAKKCVPLKCQQDFDCFRKDLLHIGKQPSGESRCLDSGNCVAITPVCVDSNPFSGNFEI